MSVEQIVDVPEDGLLNIQIPSSLKNRKKVRVIINDFDEDREQKIALMKQAATDKLFLADLEEVARDFDGIESKIDE